MCRHREGAGGRPVAAVSQRVDVVGRRRHGRRALAGVQALSGSLAFQLVRRRTSRLDVAVASGHRPAGRHRRPPASADAERQLCVDDDDHRHRRRARLRRRDHRRGRSEAGMKWSEKRVFRCTERLVSFS